MLSQLLSLRTRFKALALFRGAGLAFFLALFSLAITVPSTALLPAPLSMIPQILLPLPLAPLYALWTHTVLTYPSPKPIWRRIPPFKATLRATGPALAAYLGAQALGIVAFNATHDWIQGVRRRGNLEPSLLGPMFVVGTLVEVLACVPAHVVLTRVQASMLPADERTIVPVDEALRRGGKEGEGEAVSMREAWRSFSWRAWKRFAVLYAQVYVVVTIFGGIVLAADLFLFVLLPMLFSWTSS